MQTAVDCNGSGSNSTTTITTTQTETGNETPMTQHMLVQSSSSSTTTTTTTTNTNTSTTDDHAHEAPATNVLRHRMTAHNSNANGDMKAPKNGLTHLIDANEYLNDCVSLTPPAGPTAAPTTSSSAAQATPSKKDKCKTTSEYHDPLEEECGKMKASTSFSSCSSSTSSSPSSASSQAPLNATATATATLPPESCSSKTTSNSTSTTSSVIAKPFAKRNGNVVVCKDPEEDNTQIQSAQGGKEAAKEAEDVRSCGDGGGGGGGVESVAGDSSQPAKAKPQLITNNQMLPFDNTTSLASSSSSSSLAKQKEELSSGPLPTTMTMSSSTTSSSINSIASNASSRASSAASSPLSSVAASASSSTSTSSITPPASAAITPALLSPSSSSATSSASSSSAPSVASTPSPAAASNATATKGFSLYGDCDAELLQWQDMPQYLQFNPYVLKGYRPLQTFKGCLLSLFYWHNETINILTHAIPIVYILAIVPGLMPWDSGYRFLSFCHVFGSVAPWCGSFVYHLFMNIERGENVYYTLLKLDMVGIWVSQSFGALPLVTATTFCFSSKWKWLIILSYCLFSLWGLYKALTASSPWQRRLCFALPFTMRSLLTFFRTAGVVGGNPVALPHVFLQDAVSVIGGAIGAMRIPEKWFPGLVDYYLNSHNIMHVLVVIAVYSMHMATVKDFEWMSNTNCEAFTNATSKVLESTLNSNVEL